MTDRELLAIMGAILATTHKPTSTARSLFSDKADDEETPNDAEAIIDAA